MSDLEQRLSSLIHTHTGEIAEQRYAYGTCVAVCACVYLFLVCVSARVCSSGFPRGRAAICLW